MKKYFKKLGFVLCAVVTMTIGMTAEAATTHKLSDWQTADGNYGTVTDVKGDGTILKMTGSTRAGFEGQVSGPYSKASKAKLVDTIVEELYLDVDLNKFKTGEFFEATVSLNEEENANEELTERVIMVQEEGGKLRVTSGNYPATGWAPEFKAYIKENGLYTLRWTYKIKEDKAYANFTVLHGDVVVGTTNDVEMTEIDVKTMPNVQVRSVWINNIQVEEGVILHTQLPTVTVTPKVEGDVTVDKNASNILKDSLGNVKDTEIKDLLEKNDVTVTLEEKVIEKPAEDLVKKFESMVKGSIVTDYFDVSVLVEVADKKANLTELNETINLSVKLPELPKVKNGYTRKFYILREHNGIVEKLDANLSKDGKFISFASDKFSTYAIAYVDSISEKTPETGDNVMTFVVIGSVAIIGILAAAICLKRVNE